MLKIGELAGLCGITIKALRHYNEIGLFKPEYIDPLTNYRYYSEDQVKKLNLILDLKSIGFSLTEINLVLRSGINHGLLMKLLQEKRREAEDSIKIEELKIEAIDTIARTMLKGDIGYKFKLINNEEIDEKLARMVSIDSADSIERHAIEEAIWL